VKYSVPSPRNNEFSTAFLTDISLSNLICHVYDTPQDFISARLQRD
jgi:hypothetical protein